MKAQIFKSFDRWIVSTESCFGVRWDQFGSFEEARNFAFIDLPGYFKIRVEGSFVA